MIVQCSFCGAPLDVKAGERTAKCAYCGRTEQVEGMETLHPQTPAGWRPPQQWMPPAHVQMQAQIPLAYTAPAAAVARSGVLVLVIIAATVIPLGIGIVSAVLPSGGFSGLTGLTGLDPSATPSLGVVQIGDTATPNTFTSTSTGTVSRSGEFGKYSSAPVVVLHVTKRSVVELNVHSTNDTTLLVRLPSGVERYDDDGGDALNPRLSLGLDPGNYPVWVGARDEGALYDLTVDAFAVNELPGTDGLAFGGPPLAADVTLGPTVDPMRWTTRRSATVRTPYCNSNVSALPQVLVRTTTPRMVTIHAHADFDSTLVVRDPTGHYVCDDDSGSGNDALIETLLPVGVTAIWVGEIFHESGLSDATLVLEPHPVGETAPPTMLMPEAPATSSTTDLDDMVAHHRRELTVRGEVRGRLSAAALGSGCVGHLAGPPTVSLRTSVARQIVVRANSRTDLVLASRGPTGVARCNDDSRGRNPRLDFMLEPGETDFWVGPYAANANAAFEMTIAVRR